MSNMFRIHLYRNGYSVKKIEALQLQDVSMTFEVGQVTLDTLEGSFAQLLLTAANHEGTQWQFNLHSDTDKINHYSYVVFDQPILSESYSDIPELCGYLEDYADLIREAVVALEGVGLDVHGAQILSQGAVFFEVSLPVTYGIETVVEA